jgi:hypothetical protein
LYSRKYVLQDASPKTREKYETKEKAQNRKHILEMRKQRKWRKPTYTITWTKAPTWRRSRPSPEPTRARRWRAGLARVLAHLAVAVACRHAEVVLAGFHFYLH